ncbi:hypothetical protein AOQ84DRAFT_222741 [Glonium stellatum]|uniref:Uncharacterized protein n=1 Tax=Glonium stellatum TaxID=574774 RepID=A0A8E2F085_9PEZI|nr:hypothetical protein AOQ84DRAFT_222741 [Glonium stellatum]
MALPLLVDLLNTMNSRKPLIDLQEIVLKREEFLIPWIEYREDFLMHIREISGRNKGINCVVVAKRFNNELALGRASKYIANGRNGLDKTDWEWHDYHLRLYISLAKGFEADEQFSRILRDDAFSFFFQLVRYLRNQCGAYRANWREKLGPLAKFVDVKCRRFSSLRHINQRRAVMPKGSKKESVKRKSKRKRSKPTRPSNTPPKPTVSGTRSSRAPSGRKPKAAIAIKLSDDESYATMTDYLNDGFSVAFRKRAPKPKNSKKRKLADAANSESAVKMEASADDGGKLNSFDPRDTEQLRATKSPARNVTNEGSTDDGSEAGHDFAFGKLNYTDLEELSSPLIDEPEGRVENMIADYIFMLYDEQYKIARYEQKMTEAKSDNRLAWKIKQRKLNYQFVRMELIRLHGGKLRPELATEFPMISGDSDDVIDLTYNENDDVEEEYNMFGEIVEEAV